VPPFAFVLDDRLLLLLRHRLGLVELEAHSKKKLLLDDVEEEDEEYKATWESRRRLR
jgi:hypothetical protein